VWKLWKRSARPADKRGGCGGGTSEDIPGGGLR